MKVAGYIVGTILVLVVLVWFFSWAEDHQRYVCRSQGGTPVVWNNQVQCVFPGGAPLR